MEDALALSESRNKRSCSKSLNPCCNGRCTRTGRQMPLCGVRIFRLNPCCNGRCTRTKNLVIVEQITAVLILVVMEDALARLSLELQKTAKTS